MNFDSMNKKDLLEVAEVFGVEEVSGLSTARIKSELLTNGVTWDMWAEHKQILDTSKVDDVPASTPVLKESATAFKSARINKFILKMERENGTYEIRGYKFTRDHPFVIVEEADATWILSTQQGFRLATPSEAEQHYK